MTIPEFLLSFLGGLLAGAAVMSIAFFWLMFHLVRSGQLTIRAPEEEKSE